MNADTLKTFASATIKAGLNTVLGQAAEHLENSDDLGKLLESISRDLTDVALVEDGMKRGAMLRELQGQVKLLFEIERIRINDRVLTMVRDGLAVVLSAARQGIVFLVKAGIKGATSAVSDKLGQ